MLQTQTTTPSKDLVQFVHDLRWETLPADVQHGARRLFVDTVGAIIAGLTQDVSIKVLNTLTPYPNGPRPLGISKPLTPEALAYALGTAAHGIELDDGYRQGSVHAGVSVVPGLLAMAYHQKVSGSELLEGMVAGYEVITALAESVHPRVRKRGYHPTAVMGPLGTAQAVLKTQRPSADIHMSALGLAASCSSGLFSFLQDGGDVKRLHAGNAAQGGFVSALNALNGIQGPKNVLEIDSGFFHVFVDDRSLALKPLPPEHDWRLLDCYIKPHACCRHLQPAFEALVDLISDNALAPDNIQKIEVDTYSIAASHQTLGWHDFASAQLSFHYVLALAVLHGKAPLDHFDGAIRKDPRIQEIADRCVITGTPEMDARYPEDRPARVTLTTTKGVVSKTVDEATGSRRYPLDDETVKAKFLGLAKPVFGADQAQRALDQLWSIDTTDDVGALLQTLQPELVTS